MNYFLDFCFGTSPAFANFQGNYVSIFRTITCTCSFIIKKIHKSEQFLCMAMRAYHGVQRRMISLDNFFVFLRLLFFTLLLLYET